MSYNQIIEEIPLISYQFKDNILNLNIIYKNNLEETLQLKELNKNCEICLISFEEKNICLILK